MSHDGFRIEDVSLRVGALTIVDHLTLHLPGGTTLAITGPPASGKSTLLACLAGTIRPASGRILLNGQPANAPTAQRMIGYAPQDAQVLEALTAVENVALPLLTHHRRATDAWPEAEQELARLGLSAAEQHNLAEQLSGGQRQRVVLACATVTHPSLAILDDPTSELDSDTAQLVLALVRTLAARGSVVIIATTDAAVARASDTRLDLGDQHVAGPITGAPHAGP